MISKFKKWLSAGADGDATAVAGGRAGGRAGASADAPVLPLDLTSAQFCADPYPIYAWLRHNAPYAPVASGGVLLSRHSDVMAALSNRDLVNAPSRFSALHVSKAARYVAADMARHMPPFLDMPEHKMPRQALSRAFFAALARTEAVLPDFAATALGAPDQKTPVDLISAIARPYACRAMAHFLGLVLDETTIKRTTAAFFELFAPVQDAAQFAQTNTQLAQARSAVSAALQNGPAAGSFAAHLLEFQKDHPEFGTQHVVDNLILVLADGVENIEAAIAQTALHLGGTAQSQPPVSSAFVREVLRLQTPAQILPRVCAAQVTIGSQELSAGTPVFLALGSACRDESVFEQPDSFLLDRPEDAQIHLMFGRGRHGCIGAPLAMALILEMTKQLQASGRKLVPEAAIAYVPRFGHRWPAEVLIN